MKIKDRYLSWNNRMHKDLESITNKDIVDWYHRMWAKDIYTTEVIPPKDSLKKMSLELEEHHEDE